jgi:hypothetical protein
MTFVVVGLFVIQILAALFWKPLCDSLIHPSASPTSIINGDNYQVRGDDEIDTTCTGGTLRRAKCRSLARRPPVLPRSLL